MKLPVDDLRRALGASAFELWQRLLIAASPRGEVSLTRAEMANPKTGLTPSMVRHALERLRRAGLVSNKTSRRGGVRTVRGRLLSRDTADVPGGAWRWVRSSTGWGGQRDGCGRPERSDRGANKSSGVINRNQVGSLVALSPGDVEGNTPQLPQSLWPHLIRQNKSSGVINRNQVGSPLRRLKVCLDREGTVSECKSLSEDSERISICSLRSQIEMPALARGRLDHVRTRSNYNGGDAGDVPPVPAIEAGDVPHGTGLGLPSTAPVIDLDDPNVRSVRDLLRLDVVPGLLLADGTKAQLGIMEPQPPQANASLSSKAALDHVARLWADLTKLVFGKVDHRLKGVAASKESKMAVGVLDWWRGCAEKNIKPAEWALWELRGWHHRSPDTKPQFTGLLSAKRVRDPKRRGFFYGTGEQLGGRLVYDAVGLAYLRRVRALEVRLRQLVTDKLGLVSDEDVLAAVAEIFPRGSGNAAEVLANVHAKSVMESARLADLAAAGAFVWLKAR